MWIIHALRNNDSCVTGNPSKKHIRFRSGMITGVPPSDAHVGFEMVNGSLHNGFYFIERGSFIKIPLYAREHAEVNVFVSVSGTSFFHGAAWLLTIADPLPF